MQVFLDEDRAAGSVEGLLGDFDGDPSNDLQVDGVGLLLPVDFDLLYGDFAEIIWTIVVEIVNGDALDVCRRGRDQTRAVGARSLQLSSASFNIAST